MFILTIQTLMFFSTEIPDYLKGCKPYMGRSSEKDGILPNGMGIDHWDAFYLPGQGPNSCICTYDYKWLGGPYKKECSTFYVNGQAKRIKSFSQYGFNKDNFVIQVLTTDSNYVWLKQVLNTDEDNNYRNKYIYIEIDENQIQKDQYLWVSFDSLNDHFHRRYLRTIKKIFLFIPPIYALLCLTIVYIEWDKEIVFTRPVMEKIKNILIFSYPLLFRGAYRLIRWGFALWFKTI